MLIPQRIPKSDLTFDGTLNTWLDESLCQRGFQCNECDLNFQCKFQMALAKKIKTTITVGNSRYRKRGYDLYPMRSDVITELFLSALQRGFACPLCGVRMTFNHVTDRRAASIDHVIPRGLGGTNDRDNLRLICVGCNWKENTAMQKERKENWAIVNGE